MKIQIKYLIYIIIALHVNCLFVAAQNTIPFKSYRLQYNKPAPDLPIISMDSLNQQSLVEATPVDPAWESWSLPIGNGYLGASIFGRTVTERVQLTENSMAARSLYGGVGLTSFAEMFIDFNHHHPTDYSRELSVNNAVSSVQYVHEGVVYKRSYFASYPDKVLVIKLTASKKGQLSFTLRPEIPYQKPFGKSSNNNGRAGTVVANNDVITLAGKLEYLNILFEGQCKVTPMGGTMQAVNDSSGGKLVISNADSAIILVAVGTNYKLESHVFTEHTPAKKLADTTSPHNKVTSTVQHASSKQYEALLRNHINDYTALFNRAQVNLGGIVSPLATDSLLANYKQGIGSKYLEELYFQYGRYLLICSSRPGTLPPNLQGIWSQYDITPWTGGYWHNINIQMNYWPVFSTNLTPLFQSFVDYNLAYRAASKKVATDYISRNNAAKLATNGDNGWTIGTGATAYNISGPGGHSGPGTGALTTKMFWDYYDYTRDKTILKNTSFPALLGMSQFLSKVVVDTMGYLLASPSYSPEQRSRIDKLHYKTLGCAFDQQMIYENHNDVLKAAKVLGENEAVLAVIKKQIPRLNPVQVGFSGQIKEYREEQFYGDIEADPKHRHTSQLMALYPGTLINANTPAWLDAARVSLEKRGDKATGWGMAYRLNLWARIKDGNKAYSLLQNLLKFSTLNNLWDTHPPFQIDGNFGATAGIAEMLLQSHEGYIHLLPALPQAWDSGSFSGLKARGNFDIDLQWRQGKAQRLTILANSGGVCNIKYLGIGSASIKNVATGKTVAASAKPDMISFETTPNGTYLITAIPTVARVENPDTVAIVKQAGEKFTLQWQKSTQAVSYNLYMHVGNASSYSLLRQGVTATTTDCVLPLLKKWQHGIIKVSAVDKSGRESSGVNLLVEYK